MNLKPILVKHERTLDELSGTYAVDAYNVLYQFLTIIRQPDGTPLLNSKREITSHLSGLFYRTCSLLEKNVIPIYVFDGEPSPLKAKTIAERVAAKVEAEELMRKAREEGRLEEAARLAQRTARLSRSMVQDGQKLLDAMGLPWVQAPSEGEAQCSLMAKAGVVDAAASQDFDALLFGAPKLVRNLTFSGRRKLPQRNMYVTVQPEFYDLQENLSTLSLTHEQLVWAGILIGTDFNEGVLGIGPKKALKLVQGAKSTDDINDKLEAMRKKAAEKENEKSKENGAKRAVKKKTDDDADSGDSDKLVDEDDAENQDPPLRSAISDSSMPNPVDFAALEDLFLRPKYASVTRADLKRKPVDIAAVKKIMVDENDFSLDRVSATLERAFKNADEKQGTLGQWT
ncbi:flap endonuclease-1 [Candidatus Micrarchaeota archaeon]|nr:flap endonuclease-1 [Candidatus Micrarchaeota archaeon]